MSDSTAHRLNRSDLANASVLWKLGRDTLEIAQRLKVEEAAVYNSLRDLREREVKQAQASRPQRAWRPGTAQVSA